MNIFSILNLSNPRIDRARAPRGRLLGYPDGVRQPHLRSFTVLGGDRLDPLPGRAALRHFQLDKRPRR